jgi:hypothetical protein
VRTELSATPGATPLPRKAWRWPPRSRQWLMREVGDGATRGTHARPSRQRPFAPMPPPPPPCPPDTVGAIQRVLAEVGGGLRRLELCQHVEVRL